MATKKNVLVKGVKAVSKPAVKKPVKKAIVLNKKVVKSAKVVPVKKTPAKKPAKAVPVKVAQKKAVKKIIAKPVAKKAVTPVKPKAKVLPAKVPIQSKKPVQPIKKQLKKSPEPVKKTPIKAANPAQKIMAKKEEIKKPAVKPATEKAVVAKPAAEVKAKDIKVPAPKPVVIPKISTKTVRKYQPEFTKSVLDKGQRDMGAPSQRYSDGELMEFKELIQRKLEAAKKELSYLHGLITRKDEMGGDEGDNRYMTMEDGSLSMEREQLSQMASRQITFIDHLEKAVMRIENKTYGICRVTGKLIDKARLRAVPHATLSIEAKMGATR